jgi:hypothetical protein
VTITSAPCSGVICRAENEFSQNPFLIKIPEKQN